MPTSVCTIVPLADVHGVDLRFEVVSFGREESGVGIESSRRETVTVRGTHDRDRHRVAPSGGAGLRDQGGDAIPRRLGPSPIETVDHERQRDSEQGDDDSKDHEQFQDRETAAAMDAIRSRRC